MKNTLGETGSRVIRTILQLIASGALTALVTGLVNAHFTATSQMELLAGFQLAVTFSQNFLEEHGVIPSILKPDQPTQTVVVNSPSVPDPEMSPSNPVSEVPYQSPQPTAIIPAPLQVKSTSDTVVVAPILPESHADPSPTKEQDGFSTSDPNV